MKYVRIYGKESVLNLFTGSEDIRQHGPKVCHVATLTDMDTNHSRFRSQNRTRTCRQNTCPHAL